MEHIILSSLRRELTQMLKPSMSDEATAAARMLMCNNLDLTLTELLLKDNEPIKEHDAIRLRQMAMRIADGEPLQYVCGKADFCGMTLNVKKGVLIPRPETEELVEWIANSHKEKNLTVLDIGTGSGCIAIALEKKMNQPQIEALDASIDALQIAGGNIHNMISKVNLMHCNILTTNAADIGSYDIVVSNPPYVMESEKKTMGKNVVDYEPHTALFVPDTNPLLFYHRISHLCQNGLLNSRGWLYFEINEQKGKETITMLQEMGFRNVELRQDYCGRDRMVRAALG